MPRSSFADRVVAHIGADPVLDILGHAAKGMFLDLLMLMLRLGGDEDPRLGIGVGYPIGSRAELAFALRIRGTDAETQLETQLAALIERGCLSRDAQGVLRPPVALRPSRRQLAARANGAKGGRPCADGSPARQREMVLTIAGGGGSGSTETERKTQEGAVRVSKLKQENQAQASRVEVDDETFHRVGRAALDAAQFDPARGLQNYGIVRQWLADGATEEVIVAEIATVREGMCRRGNPPRHLGAFTDAITKATAAAGPSYPAAEVEARRRWSADIERWQRTCAEMGTQVGRRPPMPSLEAYLAAARAA